MIRFIETLLLLGVGMLLTSCGMFKGASHPIIDEALKAANESVMDDSPLEEMIEDAIEVTTGLEIDLTPSSPEK